MAKGDMGGALKNQMGSLDGINSGGGMLSAFNQFKPNQGGTPYGPSWNTPPVRGLMGGNPNMQPQNPVMNRTFLPNQKGSPFQNMSTNQPNIQPINQQAPQQTPYGLPVQPGMQTNPLNPQMQQDQQTQQMQQNPYMMNIGALLQLLTGPQRSYNV